MSGRPSPEADVEAAAAVAREVGLISVQPVVLKLAHHTTVHLEPYPIVARVDSSFDFERMVLVMRRELAVAQHLAKKGAPAVRPTVDPPPGPHLHGRAAVTLWERVEHRRAAGRTDQVSAGHALAVVHDALADYPRELPVFSDGMDTCARMLADPAELSALPKRDRAFLAGCLDALRQGLDAAANSIALHGDAHLSNALITPAGAIWADLETACRGPLEWELTSLPAAGRAAFPPLKRRLFHRLSLLRSLTVAVWCWSDADRSAEIREAAQYHLRRLRRRKLV